MSTETADWEPEYGFCAYNTTDLTSLARTLEGIRRQVCAYNWGGNSDARCDCKYGRDETPPKSLGSEKTGCPELRELINRLLHRPETFTSVAPEDAA